RSHFHVPLFVENYGVLQSTQQDIIAVLGLHKQQALTKHLEIETYTWEVLPDVLKLPITDSIIREMEWTLRLLALKR
ncbi:MAG: metabolite traffic protein EboE, partial [Chitinophagaceae bacterium]